MSHRYNRVCLHDIKSKLGLSIADWNGTGQSIVQVSEDPDQTLMSDSGVPDRQAHQVLVAVKLLHKKPCPMVELHQASKLYDLLPLRPNQLWQMDVTYVHIPGYKGGGICCAAIDYYTQYLLAAQLVCRYCSYAVTQADIDVRREAEEIHGALQHHPMCSPTAVPVSSFNGFVVLFGTCIAMYALLLPPRGYSSFIVTRISLT